MDTSDLAGSTRQLRFVLRDANVRLSEFALARWSKGFRYPRPEDRELATKRFAELCEAIETGNSAKADKVLRSWRIRR